MVWFAFYRSSSQQSYTQSPKFASPRLTLPPEADPKEPGAIGLLEDANLMAKLQDVAMVQVGQF